MANELKATVINMKSLSQNIPDPVVIGAGDANGRTLRIIFSQEAAAQLTENTKVYLSWHHQEIDVKGYNVFTQIINEDDENFPPTWEIKYPKSMLYEGNVLACIQLVDNVSIATSTNFMIHVLIDPNDGSRYTATDDFTEFQNAVISLATLSDEMRNQMVNQKIEFEDMQLEFMDVRRIAQDAGSASEQAQEIANQALQVAQNALDTIVGLTNVAREARDTAQETKEDVTQLQEEVNTLQERITVNENLVEAVQEIAQSAKDIAEAIREEDCCDCGVSEEEMNAAIDVVRQETFTRIQETENNFQSALGEMGQDFTDDINQAKQDVKEEILDLLIIKDFL